MDDQHAACAHRVRVGRQSGECSGPEGDWHEASDDRCVDLEQQHRIDSASARHAGEDAPERSFVFDGFAART
jgi:hypothetical protein